MKNNMTILSKKEEVSDRVIIDTKPSSYEEVAKKKGKECTSSRRMMSRMQY